jgi:hypothetical protein
MQQSQSHALVHGAVGGLAAGLVVALWFLGVDLIAGQPFGTPARLAGAIIGGEHVPGVRLVAAYTVLHFGVFAGLGIAAASFLRATRVAPGLLVGAVFGLVVLTAVHYGALLMTGGRLLDVLPPLHVVAANLLGGMTMMAYLHLASREAAPLGLGGLRDHPLIARGLVTGLIGAVAVAVWFFILDLARGQPFFTPAALGAALLLGATSPADVQVTLPVVASYTMLHLAAFAGIGIAVEWAAERIERAPAVLRAGVLALALLEGLFIGIVASLSQWVLGALGYWAVAVGNLLAIASMGTWVLRTHPMLRHSFGAMRQEPHTVTTGSGERR